MDIYRSFQRLRLPRTNKNYTEEIRLALSAETSTDVPEFVHSLRKIQQAIGLSRPINSFIVTSTLGINEENGYTQVEIDDYT